MRNFFRDIQIQSALLWAATILLSAVFSASNEITTVLITAAGFHCVLLAQHSSKNICNKA